MAATQALMGKSVSEKNELLFAAGVNFDALPAWHKRGTGIRWGTVQKTGLNPKTGEATVADRRRLQVDLDLPIGDPYGAYIDHRVTEATGA